MKVLLKVTVNKDGSADLDYKILLNSALLAFFDPNAGEDPIKELKTNAEIDGFIVSNFNQGDMTGIRATKHV